MECATREHCSPRIGSERQNETGMRRERKKEKEERKEKEMQKKEGSKEGWGDTAWLRASHTETCAHSAMHGGLVFVAAAVFASCS